LSRFNNNKKSGVKAQYAASADWEYGLYTRFLRCCCLSTYRQPGLLWTSRNFAQSSKFLGKKYFFRIKITS
jgi:hypothetical protein